VRSAEVGAVTDNCGRFCECGLSLTRIVDLFKVIGVGVKEVECWLSF